MCGFVSVISPYNSLDPDVLSVMRDQVRHRGPDSGDNWISECGKYGFGHRRLSILDLSKAANQPMVDQDNLGVLVFNGEIYNYIELRSELKALGYQFRTSSDTEVLLVALKHWWIDALKKLNGMFAFTYWCKKRKQILAVRDRFGEKPLFIGKAKDNAIIFSSEMKSILAYPFMENIPNRDAIDSFTSGSWYEEDGVTFFKNIRRLPAAHAVLLDVDSQEFSEWRYWTPNYSAIDRDISAREAIAKFEELLSDSVKLRMRSDVALGSSLSGGLDSSFIVGIMAKLRNHSSGSVNTFSATFLDDPTISEHNEIQSVVQYNDVNSYVVAPKANDLIAESAKLHWHQEEPFLSASIYLQWCVARLAKLNDTTVLLDGQGADELLAGYQFYFKQRQLDLVDNNRLTFAKRETQKFNRRLKKTSSQYLNSERRFNHLTAYSVAELDELADNPPSVFHYPYSIGVSDPVAGGRLRRTISEALLYNSLPMLLRYADRNSMAFSREVRLPYLDHRLVEFCISLPDEYLIRAGWQKWVQRFSAKNYMPEPIRWRADKVGYAAPLDHWLRGELRSWAEERLFDPSLSNISGYVKVEIQGLWDAHQSGQANNSWALWRWISLFEWLELQPYFGKKHSFD